MSDRYDKLASRDLAITLRSLRRRFGAATVRAADPGVATRLDAPDGSAPSLRSLFEQAMQAAALLENELAKSLSHETPVISAAALDPHERQFLEVAGPGPSPTAAVEQLADDAEAAADRIERATSNEMGRSIQVAGGGTASPARLAAELVRTQIGLLGRIEDLLDRLEG